MGGWNGEEYRDGGGGGWSVILCFSKEEEQPLVSKSVGLKKTILYVVKLDERQKHVVIPFYFSQS